MFYDIQFTKDKPIYLQIKDYIIEMISKGMLQKDLKLPSTRELSKLLDVSRNTIILAYQYLEDEGYIYTIRGKGAFISDVKIGVMNGWNIDWSKEINEYTELAEELDIMKHGIKWEKGMISFTSIAPDESLFDIEGFKRSFLDRFSLEGDKLLNYGYAKGYAPLIEHIKQYMKNKGVDIDEKDVLITNGFTEGFDILLSALTKKGDSIICENPTHNTAIKIMKLHGLDIIGIDIEEDGINTEVLKQKIKDKPAKLAYLTPSYHNPTGIVMSPEKRMETFNILRQHKVPIIEDGFNEELRYSGSHIAPILTLCGKEDGVIYIGSLSKVLFPGIRIGWIVGNKKLISYLESIKRSRNIHTSSIDQAVLYEYLKSGNFEKYINKVRKSYKEKYEIAIKYAKEYIPCKKILGEGGLHIFIELDDNINAWDLLEQCSEEGVIFTPGNRFYTDKKGGNTLRIGFSRVGKNDIVKGLKLIGNIVRKMK